MTDRLLGTLLTVDGTGVVRMEDRFEAGIDDVWATLTDGDRLAEWLGEFEGEILLGGEYRARYLASGWEGFGRIEAFEPPRHLLALVKDAEEPDRAFDHAHAFEVTLTANADRTSVVWEERGMPTDLLAAYGAGIQVQVEDLASYLAGGERCDANARFAELFPAYRDLAASA